MIVSILCIFYENLQKRVICLHLHILIRKCSTSTEPTRVLVGGQVWFNELRVSKFLGLKDELLNMKVNF